MLGEDDAKNLHHSLLHIRLGEDDSKSWHDLLHMHFATPQEARQPRSARFELGSSYGIVQTVEITLVPCVGESEKFALGYVLSMTRQLIAEKRFNQIFESLPLGLLVIDSNQKIIKVNERLAKDFGYRPSELAGQPVDRLIPERYRTAHGDHLRQYIAAPSSRMMGSGRDLSGLHKSGQEFAVEIAITRLENLRLPLFMALVTDITKRKRAEIALQQTNMQLEEFSYVASHDLRSPLRGIADLTSWIREDLGEDTLPVEVRHNFDRIALRINRAEQMIDDLLAYARAGARDPEMQLIDPIELIEGALSDAVVPSSFAVELDLAATTFFGPQAPLAASLRNLISNAVKHHGKDRGKIRISAREEGRFTLFTVEDDGQGIQPGNEDRIFKLFHRGDAKTEGDGVGLAFTRRIISAHGGMVTATGNGELGGASFVIHWPRIMLKEREDD